jgi:UDP-N-acetylmuramoylalanine-D-glutamate ligase
MDVPELAGRRVLVVGLARSGMAAAEALVRVVTWDLSDGTTAPRPFRLILEND